MKVAACRSAQSAAAECLSSRPQRLSFNKRIQWCQAQGTGMTCEEAEKRTARWQSCQPGEGPGSGWPWPEKTECTCEPDGWNPTGLSRLSHQLHPQRPVMSFSTACFNIPQGYGPSHVCCFNTLLWSNPFGLTNSCSALSKSSTELEWWPGCSMVLCGAPWCSSSKRPCRSATQSLRDLMQALVFFLNLVTSNWFTGPVRQQS